MLNLKLFERFCLFFLIITFFLSLSACSDRKKESPVVNEGERSVEVVRAEGVSAHESVDVGGDVADQGAQVQVIVMRLAEVKKALTEDLRKLREMQRNAIKADPELAMMETEYLSDKKVFVSKLNGLPEVKGGIEKRDTLREEVLLLSKQMRGVIVSIKRSEDQAEIADLRKKLDSMREEFRGVYGVLKTAEEEVEKATSGIKENDVEMKEEYARLQKKRRLLYVEKVDAIPEILALKAIQKDRENEMKKLQSDLIALRVESAGDV